jgi:tryptophan 2,3-dioxygenase
MARIGADQLGPALKALARVKALQRQLFEQWSVLETLTPTEYVQFRDVLGHASGFQSVQYRVVEFLLGNKNAATIDVFGPDSTGAAELRAVLRAPSLYDQFIRHLARAPGTRCRRTCCTGTSPGRTSSCPSWCRC